MLIIVNLTTLTVVDLRIDYITANLQDCYRLTIFFLFIIIIKIMENENNFGKFYEEIKIVGIPSLIVLHILTLMAILQ